jgi:hypothetical protein
MTIHTLPTKGRVLAAAVQDLIHAFNDEDRRPRYVISVTEDGMGFSIHISWCGDPADTENQRRMLRWIIEDLNENLAQLTQQ